MVGVRLGHDWGIRCPNGNGVQPVLLVGSGVSWGMISQVPFTF